MDPRNQRMRSPAAAAQLSQLLGLPIEPKTLSNWRAAGRGPRPEYFGLTPVYTVAELERWVEEDALKPEPNYPRRRGQQGAGTAAEPAACGIEDSGNRVGLRSPPTAAKKGPTKPKDRAGAGAEPAP